MNEIRSTNSSRAKYIPMNRAATAPMYLDDGRGSSAHVFLRTVDDNVVVFTVKFLLISSILSCKDCEDSFQIRTGPSYFNKYDKFVYLNKVEFIILSTTVYNNDEKNI